MQKVAIYARRSKEEHQAASLEVQQGEARRYISQRGWLLESRHVYIDDSTSRAEFKRRPGLVALINAAEAQEFDIVVVRDETRLGGDTFRTGLVIQELLDSGIRLFYYYTDEEVALNDAVSKFLVAARNFASELEREKISQRTHEHLHTKARRRMNVGGRVFGYDNVTLEGGGVGYCINPSQAAIVRDIYHQYAEGQGQRAIARTLNERNIPSPRAGKRGTGSWSPSAIRAILRNERYRGVYTWNKVQKTYRRGTKIREPRPRDAWVNEQAPELRIIDDELWHRVDQRFATNVDFAVGKPAGAGRRPRYLLSGIARCGICGGPLAVNTTRLGRERIPAYICAYHRDRGPAVCDNITRRPVDILNGLLIDWLRTHVLADTVAQRALQHIRQAVLEQAANALEDPTQLEEQASQLQLEISRLTSALAECTSTDAPATVIQAITDRERRLSALQLGIKAAKTPPTALAAQLDQLALTTSQRIKDLSKALTNEQTPGDARSALKALIDGHVLATPYKTSEGSRYRLTGKTSFGGLFLNIASPRGFEPRSPA